MIVKGSKTKVLVYCVREGRLLVFRHPDHSQEQVGIQVPGGSVRNGESIRDAAARELAEETGFGDFLIHEVIGSDRYDISPYRAEIQERHFVRASPSCELPERWFGQEDHEGRASPTRLEFFWIPLDAAHVLQAGQGSMIWRLV